MSDYSLSEQVIRRLYKITNNYHEGFDKQISDILEMGLERFNLDIGILSNIQGEDYFIKNCVTPEHIKMHPNDRFDFGLTYCNMTCKAEAPLAIEHMKKDDKLAKHPAYKAFGLESYIGVPIYLNGSLYGTLNFSSPEPYPRKFQEIDIDALQLMASWIEVELIRREQESQLLQLNKELQHNANYDILTNIYNRRGMHLELIKVLSRLSRTTEEYALALIDLDYFKQLNDSYGHQEGDKALVATAKSISNTLRDYDLLSRYGGDEFLVFLPNIKKEQTMKIFDRIVQSISNITLHSINLSVSIGVCHFTHTNKKTTDDMIADADKALYQAKLQGRNQAVLLS